MSIKPTYGTIPRFASSASVAEAVEKNPVEKNACPLTPTCYTTSIERHTSERSSVVELYLAKVAVVGSNPIARSTLFAFLTVFRPCGVRADFEL